MPIVSVTPLGSNASGTGAAIGQIIDYLERGSRRPEPNANIVGYYADTPTSAGVWRGRGVNAHQLTGSINTETFRTVLEGRHPTTGETQFSAPAGRHRLFGPALGRAFFRNAPFSRNWPACEGQSDQSFRYEDDDSVRRGRLSQDSHPLNCLNNVSDIDRGSFHSQLLYNCRVINNLGFKDDQS